LCSCSDDDASSLQNIAILQRDPIWPLIASELDHSLSHHHLCAEFFRLNNATAREFQTGDASWEAQVVLNL
jgi:hypothetical protein